MALHKQRGMSLVEVMVALIIGLVIVGAVLVSYLATGRTGRLLGAYAEMNENAQLALGLLSKELMLAGYSAPNAGTPLVTVGAGAGAVTTINKNYAGRPVFGCDNGFVAPSTLGVVACAATGAPAFEVAYQADLTNTVPTSAPIVPSDCLGNRLTDAGGGVYLTFNRYYLTTGTTGRSELHCASAAPDVSGAAIPGQPLVDNVETMSIWYGEAAGAAPRTVVRYVTAGNVADWGLIVSVRVCLLMRSSEQVLGLDDNLTYLDCDQTVQTSADRYLRRAYTTTATLRNKMAF